jgi:uncharacterized repeat protein (TIGR02543 family)
MRDNMPYLIDLDLSGATIVEYYGDGGTSLWNLSYSADQMPEFSFCYQNNDYTGKTSLASVILPAGLTSIGTDAFYNCSGLTSVTLPDGLTSIGYYAFYNCSGLTSVTLPAGLTSIGEGAFYSCSGLTSVTLPAGLTSIGYGAFSDCSGLTSVTLPAGLTSIGSGAFYNCSGLTSVTLPDGLTSIGYDAFYNCSGLTSVTLPAGLTSIGSSAFYNCSGLTSVTNMNPVPLNIGSDVFYGVNQSACELRTSTSSLIAYQNTAVWKEFAPITGVGISFFITVNNSIFGNVTGTANGFYPYNTGINLTAIPAGDAYSFIGWTSGGNSMSFAPDLEFILKSDTLITAVFGRSHNYNLTEAGTLKDMAEIKTITHLTLSGNIDARDIAFIRDSIPELIELDLSGATIVEYEGYEGTYSGYGSSVVYPANHMPQYSFYNGTNNGKTKLTSIRLPSGINSIGNYAFFNCNGLTSVTLPAGLASIGDYAFYNCSGLTSVTLPVGLTSIGSRAFYNCSGLTSVTLPVGLTSIGSGAFYNCSGLTSVTLPDGLTSIGSGAFYNCSGLTSITFPEGLTSIGEWAFERCIGLTSITFPEGLTSIGEGAFYSCYNLSSITNRETVPLSIGSYVFSGVNQSACELRVPSSAFANYSIAEVWKDFLVVGGDYTVTLTADNGSTTGGGLHYANANVTISATPVNSNYVFTGWTNDVGIVSTDNPYSFTVTGNISLTANFVVIDYNISYDLNGGDSNHTDNPANYNYTNATIELKAPTRAGYIFAGWTPDEGIILKGSMGDRTFTANWTQNSEYNVFYNLNEGVNNAGNPATYKVGDATIILKAPSKAGYAFTSWLPINTIISGSAGDKTFTAQWSVINYAISYELNGGVNNAGNPATYTVEDAVTLNDPSRTSYRFEGWKEGGSIAKGSIGEKTFTAQWKCTEANIEELSIDGTSIEGDEVFDYVPACGQSSLTLALEVSPQASVKIDGAPYSSSGNTIAITGNVANVTISVTSETGRTEEYGLKIIPPVNGDKLYYQRWGDVLAINRNPATNNGVNITNVRWYNKDGSAVAAGNEDYIRIQSGSKSDYYAEIQTGGEWRQVCHTETRSLDKIKAYPNPVSRGESVTLQLPESLTGSSLNIYSITGALVKSGLSLPTKSNSIDISEFVSGIYLLQITDKDGNRETVKIIVN